MNSNLEKRPRILAAICHLSALPKLAGYGFACYYFAVVILASIAPSSTYGVAMFPIGVGFGWICFALASVFIESMGVRIADLFCSTLISPSHEFPKQAIQSCLAFQASMRKYLYISLCFCTLLLFGTCASGNAGRVVFSEGTQSLYACSMLVLGWLILLGVTQFVLMIFAAIAALQGKQYRYPFTFRNRKH